MLSMRIKILSISILLFFVYNKSVFGLCRKDFIKGVELFAINNDNQRQDLNNSFSNYYSEYGDDKTKTLSSKITKIRQIEDDGYVWYKLYKSGGYYGIENIKGRIILSPIYELVYYSKNSKNFIIKTRHYEGVISKNGNWIIPLNREYNSVIASSSDEFYYVKKNGYEGVCNANGKEVISPKKYKEIIYSGQEFKCKDRKGKWNSLNINIHETSLNNQTDIVSTSNRNLSNSQKTFFRLEEGKFYKIENLLMGDYTIPFEAEITLVKLGNDCTISFCEGDGNSNVNTIELFEAKYSEKEGFSIYTLKEKMVQNGETGILKLKYRVDQNKVYVFYERIKNGRNYTNEFFMSPTPYNNPVLKRK